MAVLHPLRVVIDNYPEDQTQEFEAVNNPEAIKKHGSLAGVELAHHGMSSENLYSRMPPLGPSSRPRFYGKPMHTRAMDKSDIREFRRWHREAALRSKQAGYDVVYVYAAHNIALLHTGKPW